MDIKQQIRQEIERRKGYISVTHFAEELLAFIDSLPDEDDFAKVSKIAEDLEEAAKKFVGYDMDCDELLDYEIGIAAFIAGAEWQKKQFEKKLPLIQKSWYEEGKIAGKYEGLKEDEKYQQGLHDGKEELMKEAQEVEFYWDGDFLAIDLNMSELGYSEHDKVKIIIVKEDKEGEE